MRQFCVFVRYVAAAFVVLVFSASLAKAQTQLSSELRQKIDKLALEVLEKTGTPSASLAVVKDGQIVYVQAYGNARLEPPTPAKVEMRYCLASLSKPFTAAALLLLQEQGKLSVDDKVSKFLPELTRSGEVTIRQLLSHTSGYREFWPVDYVLPMMLQPATPRQIVDQFARKPLSFDPGTKWEISDTNYVIAGMIVEKVSGKPLYQFLQEKIFKPLSMDGTADVDHEKPGTAGPAGYMRYGIGPLRIAPHEAQGWLFGGELLAMTAGDLGRWDVSVLEQTLLKPSSYRDLETDVLLKNGFATRNALGSGITWQSGRRALYTIGDISGFSAANTIFLDDRVAVAVLTNLDAGAPSEIIRGVAVLMLAKEDPDAPRRLELARRIFEDLQHGTIDRSLFTGNGNSYFSEAALQDFAASLAPLGKPRDFVQAERSIGSGLTTRTYKIKFAGRTLAVRATESSEGKLEQFMIESE